MNLDDLIPFILPQRLEKLKAIARNRTRNLTVLLDGVHDRFNQSGIIRSCDAMGLLELHLIHNERAKFRPSRNITRGVQKWLDIQTHPNPEMAFLHLKEQGFRVYTSCFHEDAMSLLDIDFSEKVALVIGNERKGVSQSVQSLSDNYFMIPMYGFSQSFNVSVATAISLYQAVQRRIEIFGQNGDLSEDEYQDLIFQYARKTIRPKTLLALDEWFEKKALEEKALQKTEAKESIVSLPLGKPKQDLRLDES